MDIVSDSGCKIQLSTHEQRCNTGTPVLLGNVFEKPISKEVARDTCLGMLAFIVTYTCATG